MLASALFGTCSEKKCIGQKCSLGCSLKALIFSNDSTLEHQPADVPVGVKHCMTWQQVVMVWLEQCLLVQWCTVPHSSSSILWLEHSCMTIPHSDSFSGFGTREIIFMFLDCKRTEHNIRLSKIFQMVYDDGFICLTAMIVILSHLQGLRRVWINKWKLPWIRVDHLLLRYHASACVTDGCVNWWMSACNVAGCLCRNLSLSLCASQQHMHTKHRHTRTHVHYTHTHSSRQVTEQTCTIFWALMTEVITWNIVDSETGTWLALW